MKSIEISGKSIPWDHAITHWSGWNKGSASDEVLPYRLTAPLSFVLNVFAPYWADLIERESAEGGTEPSGIYQELRLAGYPALSAALTDHADLFCRVVLEDLQTELIGFLVSADLPEGVCSGFFLQSMESAHIGNETLTIGGTAVSVSGEFNHQVRQVSSAE